MIRLRTENLKPGMRLARSVRAGDGKILLSEGIALTPQFIVSLWRRGVPAVYIRDERVADVEVVEVVSLETRSQVAAQLRQATERVKAGGRIDAASMARAVDLLLEEVVANDAALGTLTDIRTADSYTFAHMVNVCVLSLVVGLSLELPYKALHELGMGAILHDVGKVHVPEEVLKKDGPLTDEEMEVMRRHPKAGYDILRKTDGISLPSAHVAYQHHERLDGTGYPRGLMGESIHQYARIAMVADVYDAMTADRIYRRGHSPRDALRYIREGSNRIFDAAVVDAFCAAVAPYPVGSLVRLDSGEVGVVVTVNANRPERPVVRLLKDAKGADVMNFAEVDLSREVDREVVEFLSI